jgi:outer membrane protein assembly factor BamB
VQHNVTHPDAVYALDAHTGAIHWKLAMFGIPAVSPTGVFIEADGIYSLRSADGTVLWHSHEQNIGSFSTTQTFIGSAIYFTGIQILPSKTLTPGPEKAQMYLYTVNATTGDLCWGIPVGSVFMVYPHGLL